jgi:hypothetical protein
MPRSDNLRKQHVEILSSAREINALLSDNLSAVDAAAIRPMLSKLAGLISLHLAMEDRSVYPTLAAHPDASVRALGKRYSDEMAGIAAVFGDYMKNWQTTAQMRADPAGFSAASKAVFNALSKRIHFEHNELYPPFDKAEA